MDWLLNILRRLLGIPTQNRGEPVKKVGSPAIKPKVSSVQPVVVKPKVSPPQPVIKVDGRQIFKEMDPLVELLLKSMAEARWISGFQYEADLRDLKWSIWKTNTVSFLTEHWTVRIIPASAQFRISAKGEPIKSELVLNKLEAALAKAAQVGPAVRNIPIENILDEQI